VSPTSPNDEPPKDVDGVAEAVRRRIARREEWRSKGVRSFARNLSIIGSYGWTLVVPTLLGVYLGRWLDQRFGSGVFWTFALLVVGVTFGGYVVWKRMNGT